MFQRLVQGAVALLAAGSLMFVVAQPAAAAPAATADQKAIAAVAAQYFDAALFPDAGAVKKLLAANNPSASMYQDAFPNLAGVLDQPDADWSVLRPYYVVVAESSAAQIAETGSAAAAKGLKMRLVPAQIFVTGTTAYVYGDASFATWLGQYAFNDWTREEAAVAFYFTQVHGSWKIDTAASLQSLAANYKNPTVRRERTVVTSSKVALFNRYPTKAKIGAIPAGTKVTVFHSYGSGVAFVMAAKVRVNKNTATAKKVLGFAKISALDSKKIAATTVKGWSKKLVTKRKKVVKVKIKTNRKKAAVVLQKKRGAQWTKAKKLKTKASGKATVKIPAKTAGKYRLVVKKAAGFKAKTTKTLKLKVKG